MDDLRDDFIAETRETLDILAEQLVRWEQQPSESALLDSVFRFFHTIKGSAGFLGLTRFETLSHEAENLLSAVRAGDLAPTPALVSAILALIDHVARLTDALESGAEIAGDHDAPLLARLDACRHAGPELAFAPAPASAPELVPDPAISDSAGDTPPDVPATGQRTVRVSLDLMDQLMRHMSDLVLARNEASRQLQAQAPSVPMEQAFSRLSATIADLRDCVGAMRTQPIERLFAFLPRLVRDTAQKLDKQVDLRIEAGQIEIDRELFERIRDPLTHIVRNAVDHGVGSPAERIAKGKSATGMIDVKVRQSGNHVLISIADNGRGIDSDRLVAKAMAAGLVTPAQVEAMDEKQRLDLIFAPGLSTADSVSGISGRGVGMDVVRSNIHALGGQIDLANSPGEGLCLTLTLPLTLTIISALMLEAGDQTFAVPQGKVLEILPVDSPHVRIETMGGGQMVRIRDRHYRLGRLETILNMADDAAMAQEEEARSILLLKPSMGAIFALSVAAVDDCQELVVRPLAPAIMAAGTYAGTALPDNGTPVLLLDVSGIAAALGSTQEAEARDAAAHADTHAPSAQRAEAEAPQAQAGMAFVDLYGRARVIRMDLVDRISTIKAEALIRSGTMVHAADGDRLERVFGLAEGAGKETARGITALRLTDGAQVCYYAISSVLDLVTIPGAISPDPDDSEVEGLVLIGHEPFGVIDAHYLFAALQSGQEQDRADGQLCYVAGAQGDMWGEAILFPLLRSAGYRVSNDPADMAGADIWIDVDNSIAEPPRAANLIRLRESAEPDADGDGRIYRYDRLGLLSALARPHARSA